MTAAVAGGSSRKWLHIAGTMELGACLGHFYKHPTCVAWHSKVGREEVPDLRRAASASGSASAGVGNQQGRARRRRGLPNAWVKQASIS